LRKRKEKRKKMKFGERERRDGGRVFAGPGDFEHNTKV